MPCRSWAASLVFFVLLFASNWQQYYYTYCIFGEQCGKQRMEIAERLRKLPLSFFGRRDLANLTETIMGDVQAMEHAYSHVLGELSGCHHRKRHCVRGVVVLLLAAGDRGVLERSGGLCRAVSNTRPHDPGVRSRARREGSRLPRRFKRRSTAFARSVPPTRRPICVEGLNAVIDAEERETTKGELANGLLVNSAFVILRLGIATTLVTGAAVVASGQVDFLVMFAFLLMVSRILCAL